MKDDLTVKQCKDARKKFEQALRDSFPNEAYNEYKETTEDSVSDIKADFLCMSEYAGRPLRYYFRGFTVKYATGNDI